MDYMEYTVVQLEEKNMIGIGARTKNSDPNMPLVIGGLWKNLFETGVYQKIEHKKGMTTIALYDDYESDVSGAYDITVGAEVGLVDGVPEGCVVKKIPQGKYARFVVKGNMQKAVAEFWEEFWKMDIKRSYKADFEEYLGSDPENCEIHIYISL